MIGSAVRSEGRVLAPERARDLDDDPISVLDAVSSAAYSIVAIVSLLSSSR